MDQAEIQAYCLSKREAYADRPFGPQPLCFRVRGKIFAQLYPDKLTLKCTPFSAEMFRSAYPGVVVRGYYCPPAQQPYWNTIYLDRFPPEDLPMMIDHAYETLLAKFPKKVQREIMGNDVI